MREFKFRAWNHHLNRMMVVHSIRLRNVLKPFVCEESYYSKDEIELMQYTGLKDKNGKEIYEGDILADKRYTNISDIVKYEDGQFVCIDYPDVNLFDNLNDMELEVVGNIFENPELV